VLLRVLVRGVSTPREPLEAFHFPYRTLHEMVEDWQAKVLRERPEERPMHLSSSHTLTRFAAERHYSWVEGYMKWLKGREARSEYHALLEEELASLSG
jgi:hypothetical protein